MNIPNNKYEAIYADLKKKIRQGEYQYQDEIAFRSQSHLGI